MKRLPIGIQTFSKIITNDYVYIDKTKYIYELIQGECYFFSRPRRFGKSLLCSTLKSLFQGKKDLFKELWIDTQTNYQWPMHPVIHIDFTIISSETPEELKASIMHSLAKTAENYNIKLEQFTNPGEMLKELVFQLQQINKNGIALLIDEYDKPILDHLHNTLVAEKMRTVLKNFYIFIKGLDEYLRFVFLTGVSRFSQTSIFSGLNQILDISMSPQFAHLAGCTKNEIVTLLSDHLEFMATDKKMIKSKLVEIMGFHYNGYRFWKDLPLRQMEELGTEIERVYNPFSIMNALHSKTVDNYWFRSGTPRFLIELLKTHSYPVESLDNLKADLSELETYEVDDLSLTTLLYQTGYLTIKSYDASTKNFTLTYPNQEVKEALFNHILQKIGTFKINQVNVYTKALLDALHQEKITEFISKLKEFYALIPYGIQIDQEKYYQTIFYVLLKLIGATIEVEVGTNIGRIDAVLETKNNLYIIEFKLNKKASVALEQIKTKKYFQRYLNNNCPITLIGISFDTAQKNIGDSVIEEYKHIE